MKKALIFFIIILYLLAFIISFAKSAAPYENFLKAFPNANIDEIRDLPEPLVKASVPREPRFAINCPPLDEPAPTDDINHLKPGHIKVVMAMGDSITAGMSALDTSIIDLLEYRGHSYSIGVDDTLITMPNILKHFSPSLQGGSTGIGERHGSGNGLNAAVSGARNNDLLGQAQWLVEQLQKDITKMDSWKILTIWIGSNNLCDVCSNPSANNGENYQTQLELALNYLKDNCPKLFVNLVGNLDVAGIYNIEGLVCTAIHAYACPCGGSFFSSDRKKVTEATKDYVQRSYSIANKFNSLKRKDFGVVVQPFLTETIIKDRKLLSSADCFHPSNKGHALGAVALWNNMLSPNIKKKRVWETSDVPICPDANTKLYLD